MMTTVTDWPIGPSGFPNVVHLPRTLTGLTYTRGRKKPYTAWMDGAIVGIAEDRAEADDQLRVASREASEENDRVMFAITRKARTDAE
jgi:hypothetical protein